jgi:hypothetical protein
MFTKFCATVSKISLVLAVMGLIAVILCVQWQVIGRYVFNDTPTWAEALAMLIVLFVTAMHNVGFSSKSGSGHGQLMLMAASTGGRHTLRYITTGACRITGSDQPLQIILP